MSVANPKRTQVATNDDTNIVSVVPKSAATPRDGDIPTVTLPRLTQREYSALRRILYRADTVGVSERDVRDLILGNLVEE